jgi:hypothetical protein
MNEEFGYTGQWWLPETPEKQIGGTLRFTPGEGAVLDLIGSFKGAKTTVVIEPEEIILGCLSNKGNVTLYKCRNDRTSYSVPGFQISSFRADVVFIGAHFHKPEDIKFKSIDVHYLHLDEWTNISGFDIQGSFDEEVVIKYKLPEPIKASINDDCEIHIRIRAEGPSHHVIQKEADIKQKTYIRIKTSEEKSFEEYKEMMYQIQNFLSLGVWAPVHPLTIEGITEANKEIKIFYGLLDIPKASKTLLPDNMLFTFKDISDRFDIFLRNWFEQAKPSELKPTHDLYFGTLYLPLMYREHHFLSLIQAIESFHRHGRRHGGKYLVYTKKLFRWDNVPGIDDEKLRQSLINEIGIAWAGSAKIHKTNDRTICISNGVNSAEIEIGRQKWKATLKTSDGRTFKLKAKEISLEERLREIFDEYQHEIPNVFIKNKGDFIDTVVVTRNYLTHYDKDLKERAASGIDIFHLARELKMLLEICLLRELGFSSEEIEGRSSKILGRYPQYDFIQ